MSSRELRQRGNALYKQMKFSDAINLYWQAAEAEPKDLLPLQNLTSAYYEVGAYARCVTVTEQALSLAKEVDYAGDLSKLKLRRLRATILLGAFPEASRLLNEDGDSVSSELGALKESIRRCAALNKPWAEQTPDTSASALHRIVEELPRFKPALASVAEYYTVGHDRQESLFRSHDAYQSQTSYLYAGIGDARHLHGTLLDIAQKENASAKLPRSQYHFTIIDLKAPAIARDILIFILLLESARDDASQTEHEEALATLFYVYSGKLMPARAYERLQWAIHVALAGLGQPQRAFPWLSILSKDQQAIRRSLIQWQTEVPRQFSTKRFLERHRFDMANVPGNSIGRAFGMSASTDPKGCKQDRAMFNGAGVLRPPRSLLTVKFQNALTDRCSEQDFSETSFQRVVEAEWMPNVTLIDLDWYRFNDSLGLSPGDGCLFDIDFNPFALYKECLDVNLQSSKCLYDYGADYFKRLAEAFSQLKSRIRIEVTVGEMCEVLEKIRYGMTENRPSCQDVSSSPAGAAACDPPMNFPRLYDRVHLSNVPDYIGGTLGSLLFAAPITRVSKGNAFFTSTVLLNNPSFETIEAFINEYCCLDNRETLFKLFACEVRELDESMWFARVGYVDWYRPKTKLGFSDLLDRDSLATWLYAIFLKIALPTEVVVTSIMVRSPFNLNVFFRILVHLKQVGYPVHWLEDVLSNLLSDNVHTRARAPVSAPLEIAETRAMRRGPVRRVGISPFVAELTTLASIWLPALGFGLLNGATAVLPASSIGQYSVVFNMVMTQVSNYLTFVLLLYDDDIVYDQWDVGGSLKGVISGDAAEVNRTEHGAANNLGCEARVHVISTWVFAPEERCATFWLRSDLMDKIQQEEPTWSICILRTDNWMWAASPQDKEQIKRIGCW